MVVNCDQDYKPDLNPGPSIPTTKPESDTPTATVTATGSAMSTTTDTPTEHTTANTTKRSADSVVDAAVSEVWYLKPITFAGKRVRIITQNFNGSVSIAQRTEVAPQMPNFSPADRVHL